TRRWVELQLQRDARHDRDSEQAVGEDAAALEGERAALHPQPSPRARRRVRGELIGADPDGARWNGQSQGQAQPGGARWKKQKRLVATRDGEMRDWLKDIEPVGSSVGVQEWTKRARRLLPVRPAWRVGQSDRVAYGGGPRCDAHGAYTWLLGG